ncbi:putative aminopeptidase [hydrothermal vent metagenome]|uniref:Putative aminopeptidase n=1 Tax=hydrothermal vent metagenome TaxID=652676 RepID=A0A3B0YQ12_9ZZZZ
MSNDIRIHLHWFALLALSPSMVLGDEPFVDSQSMATQVTTLSTLFPARHYNNIKVLNACRDHIVDKFRSHGFKPVLQTYSVNGKNYSNIIAYYGPVKAPLFIVGAHYDVDGNTPGADDNASGVVGLLELARLLNQLKPTVNFRIALIAYTLEEQPFFRSSDMGSYQHALSLKRAAVSVKGMVSLEMIGYYTEKQDSQQYPSPAIAKVYPSVGNFIALIGNQKSQSLVAHFKNIFTKSSTRVEALIAPQRITGVDFSDHMNYWKMGYVAFMITDTAFFRNPHYHKNSDKADTLNYKKAATVVENLYRAIISL